MPIIRLPTKELLELMEKMEKHRSVAQWLKERCQREHLSYRKAGAKIGLSHNSIASIINGERPSPATISKLARAFGDGTNEMLALEDRLLVLAGYRTERPEGEEPGEAYATLIDKVSKFNDHQIKMMVSFADFLMGIEGED